MNFKSLLKRALSSEVLQEAYKQLPPKEQELVVDSLYKPVSTFSDMIDLNFDFFMTRDYFPDSFDTLIDRHFEMFITAPEGKEGVRW